MDHIFFLLEGRKLHSAEALTFGLVSKVAENKDAALKAAMETAATIVSMSPVAVAG